MKADYMSYKLDLSVFNTKLVDPAKPSINKTFIIVDCQEVSTRHAKKMLDTPALFPQVCLRLFDSNTLMSLLSICSILQLSQILGKMVIQKRFHYVWI